MKDTQAGASNEHSRKPPRNTRKTDSRRFREANGQEVGDSVHVTR
jgi:hypothetical protein